MAETNKITKLALNENSYNIGGAGSTDPFIIQLTDPESMTVNFTELKAAIDENRPVYISKDGYNYGIEIFLVSDTEIILGFDNMSILMVKSDNAVKMYSNHISPDDIISDIFENSAIAAYGLNNGIIDITKAGSVYVVGVLLDDVAGSLTYYHGSGIAGTTKLSEVPHFEITEAPDVPSVQTISSSNDLKFNQINADIVKLNNYTVDSVAYTGVANFSSDGTNYTLICGDLYVRGTGDQTVATATTRWKFSDMINKTVLTALYS